MHTSIERRQPSLPRMPVTMSVELAHDGWEETYEADLTNLSGSGIGVRGPVLPDVGQRMRCRFTLAELGIEDGGTCETEGEVVWASDAGDAGEFGIRFDGLEPRVGEALARWVSTLEAAGSETPSEPVPSPVMRAAAPKRRQVRVQLDGVASPIEAEVAVTEGHRVRVEQALPFLLLGTSATVDAGGDRMLRRVLRSVELKIEGSVPKLVLELERTEASIAEDVNDDGVNEGPATIADAPLDELLASASHSALDAADVDDDPAPRIVRPAPSAKSAAARAKRREDDSPRAVRIDREERDALAELGVAAQDLDEEPEATPMGERLAELRDRVKPTVARLGATLRAAWATAVASSGPRLRAVVAWLSRVSGAVRDRIAAQVPVIMARLKKEPIKRRTTMAPPEAEPRAGRAAKRAEAAPEPVAPARPKIPLRLVLVGGLAALALFFGVRAMTAPAAEEPIAHAPTLALAPEEPEVEEPVIEAPAVSVASPVVAEPVEVAPAPAPELPGTLAASSTAAGRLAAPTFPRVGDAPAEEAPAEEPSAEESLAPPSGTTRFGASDVPHGRSTTLTMTLPITSIEGEANDSGFTVNLPGVNSLSRAAPIAAANPSVERAAILNSGDHAVLTVRFVPGRSPAYRVEARGSDLIVTIGR